MKQPLASLHIAEIRALAKRYDAGSIEHCMELALANKANPCYLADEADEVVNVLAKTGFVLELIQQGKTLNEAIRELGKRIRAMQSQHASSTLNVTG